MHSVYGTRAGRKLAKKLAEILLRLSETANPLAILILSMIWIKLQIAVTISNGCPETNKQAKGNGSAFLDFISRKNWLNVFRFFVLQARHFL